MTRAGRMLLAVFLSWCALGATPSSAQTPPAPDCSVLGQTRFVHETLDEFYFWYQHLPDVALALFDSPEAYLDAVRFRPLDESFSFISSKQADDAFFSNSQFIGFGFSSKLLATDDLRITQVFPDGPAAAAGLERGFRLLEINGRSVKDLVETGDLATIFGPAEMGVPGELRYRDLSGREARVSMAKALVTIPTVSLTRVYDVDGIRVGYIVFRNFVSPSGPALTVAFGELLAAGATELVLDLRYNGGGLVSVAQQLGGLIGGVTTSGQVFGVLRHNDKNTFRDQTMRFADVRNALDLKRLIVITTRGSASASELIINALRPFMSVIVVGDTTFGKPVGQYGFEFCDKVLHPVSFTIRNALDEGDFFAGIAPTCAAADELSRAFGDTREASLAEALFYVKNGACSAASAAARTSLRSPVPLVVAPSGWDRLLGAH